VADLTGIRKEAKANGHAELSKEDTEYFNKLMGAAVLLMKSEIEYTYAGQARKKELDEIVHRIQAGPLFRETQADKEP
jgi:hypothetical protein